MDQISFGNSSRFERGGYRRRRRADKAITLVELLLGIAILAILGGIGVPIYNNYTEKARVTAAIAGIRTVESEVSKFQAERGRLPDGLAEVGLADRLDPWGNPYHYLRIQGISKHDLEGRWRKDRFLVPINSDYDAYSMGKDGMSKPPLTCRDSRDDVVRANNGTYVGLASDY